MACFLAVRKTIIVYTNSHTLGRYILQNLQHFASKIDKTFKMPFVADVHDLFILHTSKFNLGCKPSIGAFYFHIFDKNQYDFFVLFLYSGFLVLVKS